MDKEKIIKCLEKHLRWVNDEEGGEKANLSEANLSEANLRGANLKVFHGGKWVAYIDPWFIRIGCQFFSVSEWNGFSDEKIGDMDCDALEFWKENKAVIMTIAKQLQDKFQDNKEAS